MDVLHTLFRQVYSIRRCLRRIHAEQKRVTLSLSKGDTRAMVRQAHHDTVGLIMMVCLIALSPYSASARVLINEIMWSGSDLSSSDEWVELARDDSAESCETVLSLSGIILTSVNTSGTEVPIIRFGPGASIECDAFPVVSRFDADHSRLSHESAYMTPSMVLPNTKLLVRLRDALGSIIDEADDGIGEPMAGKNGSQQDPKRASMERVNSSLQGGLKESWTTATESIGFDDGAPMLGSPGFPNVVSNFSSSNGAETYSSTSDSSYQSSSISSYASTMSSSQTSPEAGVHEPQLREKASGASSVSNIDQIIYSSSSSEPSTNSSSSVQHSTVSLAPRSSPSEVGSVPSVIISELLPNPVGQDTNEWIELVNLGSDSVDFAGWTLNLSGSSTVFQMDVVASPLLPGEYRSFRKAQTGLSLPNKGGSIVLRKENQIIDIFSYPELPDGISFGRQISKSSSLNSPAEPRCVPTEGAANTQRLPNASIQLQAGRLEGEGSVTVNFEASLEESIRSSAECFWDFQDGFTSGSCNPPSHTFDVPGAYAIRLQVLDYCINTLVQSVDVYVLEKPSQSSKVVSKVAATAASSPNPNPNPNPLITISGVLPNPIGLDQASEWIEVRNDSPSDGILDGWKLSSTVASRECPLGGLLKAKEKRKYTMKDCPIGLSNELGRVRLVDLTGQIRSVVEWQNAIEGRIYKPSLFDLENGDQVFVHRVIDGDTIQVIPVRSVSSRAEPRDALVIRLLGIDAPEIVHPNRTPDPYGNESMNFLRALIEGQKIELQFDAKKEDSYGRLLAYTYLDGSDVQSLLLQNGLARVYLGPTFSKKEEYLMYESKAREEGKGMWAIMPRPGTGAPVKLSQQRPSGAAALKQSKRITQQHPFAGAEESAMSIYINALYPSPLKGEEEWIELFNPNDVPVSLQGWALDDLPDGGSKPWVIPDGWVIGAGEYRIIRSADSKLKLNDDGDEVTLRSPDGSFTDRITYVRAKSGQKISKNDQKKYSENSSTFRAPSKSIANKNQPSIGIATRYKTPIASASSGDLLMSRETSTTLASLRAQIVISDKISSGQEDEFHAGVKESLLAFIGLFGLVSLARSILRLY